MLFRNVDAIQSPYHKEEKTNTTVPFLTKPEVQLEYKHVNDLFLSTSCVLNQAQKAVKIEEITLDLLQGSFG